MKFQKSIKLKPPSRQAGTQAGDRHSRRLASSLSVSLKVTSQTSKKIESLHLEGLKGGAGRQAVGQSVSQSVSGCAAGKELTV